MKRAPYSFVFVVVSLSPLGLLAQTESTTAARARAVLQQHCYRCHGENRSAEGGVNYVLDAAKLVQKKKFLPGDPTSGILERLRDGSMPPETEKSRPSSDEIKVLEQWVREGAPAFPIPTVTDRERVLLTQVYQAMHRYLSELELPADAGYKRFVLLDHLHNDPRKNEASLALARASVSKLLNSLSWRKRVVVPQALDKAQTVLVFDLRDVDWDVRDNWSRLVSRCGDYPGYPYALTHDRLPPDATLNRLAADVYRLTGTNIPAVRADWFVATASLAPLYDELLGLPSHAGKLETALGVDVAGNFRRNQLVRAGLLTSGVSARANRLVERHDAAHGAYWKSYDFRTSSGSGSLIDNPLGPLSLFPTGKHPYPHQAFVHDGGEIIFHLPNGLQGYLLVNGKDERIDEAPADVVRDKKETAGRSTAIVNGLSCMACHAHGLIQDNVSDAVRSGAVVQGDARLKVDALYPRKAVVDELMSADNSRFLLALEQACGSFLRVGPSNRKSITEFPEAISHLATPFLHGNMTVEDGTHELGLAETATLIGAIRTNPRLRDELGLRPWLTDGTVKRELWQSVRQGRTVFQLTASELERGVPTRSTRP